MPYDILTLTKLWADSLIGSREYAVISQADKEHLDATKVGGYVVENHEGSFNFLREPLAALNPGLFRLWHAKHYETCENRRQDALRAIKVAEDNRATMRQIVINDFTSLGLPLEMAKQVVSGLTDDALKVTVQAIETKRQAITK